MKIMKFVLGHHNRPGPIIAADEPGMIRVGSAFAERSVLQQSILWGHHGNTMGIRWEYDGNTMEIQWVQWEYSKLIDD